MLLFLLLLAAGNLISLSPTLGGGTEVFGAHDEFLNWADGFWG
jgi:hypothetical protein